ncbi:MAG: ABC transporter permease subunit [Acidimicrobiaceae bacterium]|nr:ABC transporter permease subunit [Acidimicrobiaceae bacterium]MDE0515218.1 ABC transporter permease subunit [Acidimicrobiaceae bacterium]MDE0657082.1 ABC transporter permease subunit [Acidimicrobiaceae bacterium]MXZ96762.1 ABC transporter permease subunit [Acidimicrobiaceae bacterium]MYF43086.1 ABC transporter permease subunit [Acidimicrobiaceae bacterium]
MTDASVAQPMALTAENLQIASTRRRREVIVRYCLLMAALGTVVVSALIVWSLVSEAWTFITGVAWADTWGQLGWFPRRGLYDIPTIVIASIIVTAIAMLVAGPLGLGAAVYLSEYANRRVRAWLKPALEILAGIPSVVLGFFALTWIAPNLVGRIGKNTFLVVGVVILIGYAVIAAGVARNRIKHYRASGAEPSSLIVAIGAIAALVAIFALVGAWLLNVWLEFAPARAGSLAAAGIGVGVLTIPLVASISEDAMAAVPDSLRQASAGLGARRMTTATTVVLPAAISGIVAAFIVAVSRAIGETMVVFLAGGAADAARFTDSPFEGSLTMTAAMASLASGTDSVVGEGLTFQSLYFVGLMLFGITLGLNVVAARFVARVREAY